MKARVIFAAAALALAGPALAETKVRVAAPHPTSIQVSPTKVGLELGYFKAEGLDVEVVYMAGGSDIQNAVISGAVDIGVQAGVAGALSAIQQGAPVEVISAAMTGASDFFWYVRADSGIKSLAEMTADQTIGFSRPGSSSELVLRTLLEAAGSKAKPVATGSPPETQTQVMSGQVDAGWGVPPLTDQLRDGTLTIIARGNDVESLRSQIVRVNVANADYLAQNEETVRTFLRALKKATDALYTDPKAQEAVAAMLKFEVEDVKEILSGFLPQASAAFAPIGELDIAMAQAIANKQLAAPLSAEQIARIHDNVARLNAN